jgi:hypothetical protein
VTTKTTDRQGPSIPHHSRSFSTTLQHPATYASTNNYPYQSPSTQNYSPSPLPASITLLDNGPPPPATYTSTNNYPYQFPSKQIDSPNLPRTAAPNYIPASYLYAVTNHMHGPNAKDNRDSKPLFAIPTIGG